MHQKNRTIKCYVWEKNLKDKKAMVGTKFYASRLDSRTKDQKTESSPSIEDKDSTVRK